MARLSEEEINEIRASADIVDVVGSYVSLERKGKNYWCACPFHDDHSPSMSLSTDKQIYKCFVCGAGGNVFTFVQNYEKVSFVQAVAKVGEMVGKHIDVNQYEHVIKVDPKIAIIHQINEDVIKFTSYQLDNCNDSVKEYLTKRCIDKRIINDFQLGFNPGGNALYKFLHQKKYQDEDLIKAGVVHQGSSACYDVFAQRLLIPIHDQYGHPIGFTARRLLESDDAKYINTQETPVYVKGNIIFNYHRAKIESKNSKVVYLVEGAMDVLAFEKANMHNVVATLGTACTNQQINLLKSLHTSIIVCYDGDCAGQDATYKFGKLANTLGCPFEVINNMQNMDPDDYIETYGVPQFKKQMSKSSSWIQFLFTYLQSKYELDNYSQKKEFAQILAKEIQLCKDHFEKDAYFEQLKVISGFQMNSVLTNKTVIKEAFNKPVTKAKVSGSFLAQLEILTQMLSSKKACNYYVEELGFLQDINCNALGLYIIEYYKKYDEIAIAQLFDFIQEDNVKKILLEVSNWELGVMDTNIEILKDAILKVKTSMIDSQISALNKKIFNISDPIEKANMADEKNKRIQARNELLKRGR